MSKSPDATSLTRQVTFDTDLKHLSTHAEIDLPVIGGKTEDTRSINSITYVESQTVQTSARSLDELEKSTKAKKISILKKASEKGLKLSKRAPSPTKVHTKTDNITTPDIDKVNTIAKGTKIKVDADSKSINSLLDAEAADCDIKQKGSPVGLNLIRKALLAKEISATSLKRVINTTHSKDKQLQNKTDTSDVNENKLPVNNPPSETKLIVSSVKRAAERDLTNNNEISKRDQVWSSPTPIRIEKVDTSNKTDKKPPFVTKENSNSSLDRGNKIQDKRKAKMDNANFPKRESYEAIYAERNTLYKAEATYRRRIKQLEEEANGFLRTIEDLSSENKLLRSNIEFLENDLKGKDGTNLLQKSVALEKEKIDLENRVKHLETLLNNETVGNETDESKQKQIRELKANVIQLQTENQTVNDENIKLKSEHFQILKKLHELEKKTRQTATSDTVDESDISHELQNEYSQLKKEYQILKEQNAEKEKKVNSLDYENRTLSESLTRKKKELDELLNAMQDENKFGNEITYLKGQLLSLEAEKEKADETQTKLEKTMSERDEFKIRVDELGSEKNLLKTKFDAASVLTASQVAQIERMKGEIIDLMKDLELSKDVCEKLKTDTDSSTVDLVTASVRLEELQTAVDEKQEKINILETEIADLKSNKDLVNENARQEIRKLNNEIDRLSVVEAALVKMEKEMKHFVEKLEDSEITKKQISMKLEDKGGDIANLEKQIFELNVKIDSMKQRICVLDRDKRDMENEKLEWEIKRDKFNDIEASNKRLTEENKRLRAVIEDAKGGEPVALQPITPDPVSETWVGNNTHTKRSQRAIYVGRHAKKEDNERKKVLFSEESEYQKRRIPYSKPVPSRQSKSQTHKKDQPKSNVALSRSLEDLALRSPEAASPTSSTPSLPDVNSQPRLTYGMGYTTGYATIHRNRVKAAGKHRVY